MALAAVGLVAFSFCWVFSRPFRRQKLAGDQVQLTVLHWGDKNEDAIVAQLCKDFESLPENRDIRLLRINLEGRPPRSIPSFRPCLPPAIRRTSSTSVTKKAGDLAAKDLLADLDELIEQDKAAGGPDGGSRRLLPVRAPLFPLRSSRGPDRQGAASLLSPRTSPPSASTTTRTSFAGPVWLSPPNDDWTWDEFIERARAIARLPDCYGADFVTWEAVVRVFLWTNGKDFTEDNWAHYTFEDPQVQAVLEKLQGWFHNEHQTLVSAKTQLETLLEPFLAGNVGMAGPLGRWKCPTYRLIDKFDWDFAPLPHAKGCKPRNGIFTTGWAIAKNSPRREQGWRLIKYLNGRRGQALMSEGGLAMPALKSVGLQPGLLRSRAEARQLPGLFSPRRSTPSRSTGPPNRATLHQFRVRLEDIFKMNKPVGPGMLRVAREWRENDELLRHPYPPMPWAPRVYVDRRTRW